MKITYDSEVDAMYIKLKEGVYNISEEVGDSTIIDLDKNGNVIGIEILDASKRIPTSLAKSKMKQ